MQSAPNPSAEADDAFGSAVQALGRLPAQSAAVADPAALAYALALARRGALQDAAVQRWLAPRLAQATAALVARAGSTPCEGAIPSVPETAAGAWAPLHQALAADANGDLKSVRRLRPALARWRVEREIAHAQAGGPENPGPLNSEHLMLRALQHMQAAAPGYLDAFVTQMETLWWLDNASGGGQKPRVPTESQRRAAGPL